VRILDIIAGASFVTAIVALPFLIWKWSIYLTRRRVSYPSLRDQVPIPLTAVLFFIVPILVAMAAADTSQHIAHDQILDQLAALKDGYHISINGRAAENPSEVLAALKKLDWLPAHHSSPTKSISVQISDGSSVTLQLARDSGNPSEYWVFDPKHYITRHNEIGRIITPLFDAY
jgi:hypothetical protein